jgi:DNA-binding GntR family transcriptional regulator
MTPDDNNIYELVMDAIVTQKLAPSQKVSENILSEMFGISRTVAKNLIERLIAQQFLVSLSPRITQVAPLTLLDIRQNFMLRRMLLPDAISLSSPNIDLEEMGKLEEIISPLIDFTDEESALKLLKINKKMNLALCSAVGYPLMLDWLKQLEDTAMRIYWLYLKTQNTFPYVAKQHRALLETIKSGDPRLLKQSVHDNLIQTEGRVFNAIFSKTDLHKQDLLV